VPRHIHCHFSVSPVSNKIKVLRPSRQVLRLRCPLCTRPLYGCNLLLSSNIVISMQFVRIHHNIPSYIGRHIRVINYIASLLLRTFSPVCILRRVIHTGPLHIPFRFFCGCLRISKRSDLRGIHEKKKTASSVRLFGRQSVVSASWLMRHCWISPGKF
jgi:hypothetical protein